jgi:hypothetical protein
MFLGCCPKCRKRHPDVGAVAVPPQEPILLPVVGSRQRRDGNDADHDAGVDGQNFIFFLSSFLFRKNKLPCLSQPKHFSPV